MLPAHHLGCGKIHGVQAGGTEAADLHAGHGLAEARLQRRKARDVGAGFADRIDHAENDVIDGIFREVIAVLQRLQRHGRERERGDFVQRAVRLAAAARGADVVVNIGICHGSLLIAVIGYDRRAVAIIRGAEILRTLPRAVP
ncbi:hypothetical protein ACVWWR_003826 [Bradyrhizobium sp. LM3.2]